MFRFTLESTGESPESAARAARIAIDEMLATRDISPGVSVDLASDASARAAWATTPEQSIPLESIKPIRYLEQDHG